MATNRIDRPTRLTSLPPTFDALRRESILDGHAMLARLAEEWSGGGDAYRGDSAAMFGIVRSERLVAIGGVTDDPYMPGQQVARVRHVYVALDTRRGGAGRAIVGEIIALARAHYRALRLRTGTREADAFYRSLGFLAVAEADATHRMDFR